MRKSGITLLNLEVKLRAVRLATDEWMTAHAIDLYDEDSRGKVEKLQWQFGQKLLALELVVIIEWGTWAKSERDPLRRCPIQAGCWLEWGSPPGRRWVRLPAVDESKAKRAASSAR